MKKMIASLPMVSRIALFVAILASALLLFSATEAKAKGGHAGLVDCYANGDGKEALFASLGEKDKDRNKVRMGHKMTWYLFGPPDTRVRFDFPDSPFKDGPQIFDPHIVNKPGSYQPDTFTSPKVAPKKDSTDPDPKAVKSYPYKITCYYPETSQTQSQPAKSDPIIDVPHK